MTLAHAAGTITPDELLLIPDNNTMELVDGKIVEKNVSVESSETEGIFNFRFQMFLLGKSSAKAYPASLGYRCFPENPGKVRRPDATVVRMDRLKELDDPDPGYMPIVPDLAVEVISPGDLVNAVDEKIQEFLNAGFPLIWVADPKARTITVYPRGGWPTIYTAEDEMTAESVLPGFRCKVDDFFPSSADAPVAPV